MRDGLWGYRLTWLLTFGGGVVLWGLLFGWDRNTIFGGALGMLAWILVGLLLDRGTGRHGKARHGKARRAEVERDEEIDWLARGSIEVRLAGRKQRYLATFTPTAPAVETADRHERRVLETMRAVGMPPATLVALDADAPEELDLVELPRRL